jgi:hypothetical protein
MGLTIAWEKKGSRHLLSQRKRLASGLSVAGLQATQNQWLANDLRDHFIMAKQLIENIINILTVFREKRLSFQILFCPKI